MEDRLELERMTVAWDAPSHAVVVQFLGFVEGGTLRKALERVIELMASRLASRLISDLREMKVLSQKDQQWIDEDWLPRAKAAGLRTNAILLPTSALARLSAEAITQRVENDIHLGYFSDIDDARQWLATL